MKKIQLLHKAAVIAAGSVYGFSALAGTVVGDGVNIGTGASSTNGNAVVVGNGASDTPGSTQERDVVIGVGASSNGSYRVTNTGGANTVVGGSANVNGFQGTAIGERASATTLGTTIGADSSAGTGSTSLGVSAISDNNSIAIGYGSRATEANSIAIGPCSNSICAVDPVTGAWTSTPLSSGTESVTIGINSRATADKGVALGSGAVSSGMNSSAFGANASATNVNSVALGVGSTTTRDNTVEVGGRQITGVAAGVQGTDGVNVDQLNAAVSGAKGVFQVTPGGQIAVDPVGAAGSTGAQGINLTAADGQASNVSGVNNLAVQGTTTTQNLSVNAGGTVNMGGNQVHGVAAGTAGTDAVNVDQLNTGMSTTLTNANAYTDSKVQQGIQISNAYTDSKVQQGIQISNAYTDGAVKKGVAQANGYTDSEIHKHSVFVVNDQGKTVFDKSPGSAGARTKGSEGVDFTAADGQASNVSGVNNLTVQGTTTTQNLSVNAGGTVNMGGNQVHGVAAGTAGTDAVNMNQLNETASGLNHRIDGLNDTISDNRKIAAAGVAAAMAMNTDMVEQKPGEYALGAGIGTYDGAAAVAVTGSYLFRSGDKKISAGIAGGSGGKVGARIGFSMRF